MTMAFYFGVRQLGVHRSEKQGAKLALYANNSPFHCMMSFVSAIRKPVSASHKPSLLHLNV